MTVKQTNRQTNQMNKQTNKHSNKQINKHEQTNKQNYYLSPGNNGRLLSKVRTFSDCMFSNSANMHPTKTIEVAKKENKNNENLKVDCQTIPKLKNRGMGMKQENNKKEI